MVESVDPGAAVSPVGTSAVASSPAVRRAILARQGPPASRLELTRITSIFTSPLPALVRDSLAAPPASIPTKVGFTIAFFGGVAAIVLFYLNWLVRGCFLAKSDVPDGFLASKNVKGGVMLYGTISVPARPYLRILIFQYSSNQVGRPG